MQSTMRWNRKSVGDLETELQPRTLLNQDKGDGDDSSAHPLPIEKDAVMQISKLTDDHLSSSPCYYFFKLGCDISITVLQIRALFSEGEKGSLIQSIACCKE